MNDERIYGVYFKGFATRGWVVGGASGVPIRMTEKQAIRYCQRNSSPCYEVRLLPAGIKTVLR